MPPPALGPPLPIPPALETLHGSCRLLTAPLALCDPSPASHGTSPSGTQASRSMGPHHKRASHACKPFFISVDPSPLPTPHGHGHGSCEAFTQIHMASGLEGLQPRPAVFALPPPSQGASSPAPARAQHYRGPPVFCRPAAHTGAGALSRYRSAASGPHRGFPQRASLPFTRPHRPIPSAVLNGGSRAVMVMRTGYRASNGTQVVAAFTPSAHFMFRIYRDLDPPYGVAPLLVAPPYVRYTLPPYPVFPPLYSPLTGFRGLFLRAWSCGRPLSLGPDALVHFVIITYV